MEAVKSLISRFVREDEGASLVEYGLLVALIAVVCIAAVTAVGLGISGMFDDVEAAIDGVGGGGDDPEPPPG